MTYPDLLAALARERVTTFLGEARAGAGVFVVLGGIQIVATAVIVVCAARYTDTACSSHLHRQPEVKAFTGRSCTGSCPSNSGLLGVIDLTDGCPALNNAEAG